MTERGLCACGCGQPAPLARRTNRSKGWIKGQPLRYIDGHQGANDRYAGPADALGERAGVGQAPGVAKNVTASKGPEVTTDKDGGTFTTGPLDRPLELATDWADLLRSYGLDPAIFEVVDDTVRMAKWQQSKGLDDGSRDVIWLYSYSARFRRRPPAPDQLVDLDELRAHVRSWTPAPRRLGRPEGPPATFVCIWADHQVGKSEGGGVDAFLARMEESYRLTLERLEELRADGRNIERVAIIDLGDCLEGIFGNYDSQLFTVQLTMRQQFNLVVDIRLKGFEYLRPDTYACALSNHGEIGRLTTGGKQVSSTSDNWDGIVGDQLQRIFQYAPNGPSEWHVPHDEMVTMLDLSGLPVAITHGHVIPSNEEQWLQAQSLRMLRMYGREPRLWLTAHRHSVKIDDFGSAWRLQAPTLDGGSPWFTNATGKWATPGTMTFLAGRHDPRGWSDMAILGTTPGMEEVVA